MSNLFLVVLIFIGVLSTCGIVISWGRDHLSCLLSLQTNETECHEVHYFREAKIKLLQNISTHHNKVYNSIINMFDDLRIARIPTTVVFHQADKSSKYHKIHPVSFPLPERYLLHEVPTKSQPFCSVVPGNYSTYFAVEDQYYKDIQNSMFTFTHKKGGWDCFRHLEILANGGIPLFLDISSCPASALAAHPKKLYELMLTVPGLSISSQLVTSLMRSTTGSVNYTIFDNEMYLIVTEALLHYTRQVLTAKAMVSYLLDIIQSHNNNTVPAAPKILYLTHLYEMRHMGDYLIDLILVGLKTLLDEQDIIDYPRRSAIYKTLNEFNSTGFNKARSRLGAKGFMYGNCIHDALAGQAARDEATVLRHILAKRYDLVIIASAHRMREGQLPFWSQICSHYSADRVVVLDGGDDLMTRAMIAQFAPCANIFFSREGFKGASQSAKGLSAVPNIPNNSLIKINSDRSVYLVVNGTKCPFNGLDAFVKRGFEFSQVKLVEEEVLLSLPFGDLLQ